MQNQKRFLQRTLIQRLCFPALRKFWGICLRISLSGRARNSLFARLEFLEDQDSDQQAIQRNAVAQCHKDDSLTESLGIFGSSADSSRSISGNSYTAAYAGDANRESSCDHSQTSSHVGSSGSHSSGGSGGVSTGSRSDHGSGKDYQANNGKRSELPEEGAVRLDATLNRTILKTNSKSQNGHRKDQHHHSSCRHNKYLQFSNRNGIYVPAQGD